nr:immunoglobulin heavy chain junction region [Macaca mulatta]MOW24549.1 immunoglobulin heavy chain junction region [Macaca mulatta]MOW24735.1 immunoglobulin heavy chain junction region [Macaca mulatta]MOW25122.1 immunoglobulin heavy chain junction region [Macaca mulatta]MOW25270.1 immunoglobulin heavy chain junction region [Macaca mulatta]
CARGIQWVHLPFDSW